MKKILLSIQPEWVEKILNGEKTIEIRKTMPKCELPCEVFIYCCKDKGSLYEVIKNGEETGYGINDSGKSIFVKVPSYKLGCGLFQDKNGNTRNIFNELCGKVVAKFILNYIEYCEDTSILNDEEYDLEPTALTSKEIQKYGKSVYAWHIYDLQIFDKPFDLCEQKIGDPKTGIAITKAPQSWCYCEYDEKNGFLPF